MNDNSRISDKVAEERQVLAAAMPELGRIYGKFKVDESQIDRPDAALDLETGKRVGIEITTIDAPDGLQYMRDPKISEGADLLQTDRLSHGFSPLGRPTKLLSIDLARDYLASGALRKHRKYADYHASGAFDELVLVTFSDYIRMSTPGFSSYYAPMANWVLCRERFPFDRVIFVCKDAQKAVTIYDKRAPAQAAPPESLYPNRSSEVATITGKVGMTVNLYAAMSKAPLAPNLPPEARPGASRARRAKKKKER